MDGIPSGVIGLALAKKAFIDEPKAKDLWPGNFMVDSSLAWWHGRAVQPAPEKMRALRVDEIGLVTSHRGLAILFNVTQPIAERFLKEKHYGRH